MRKLSNSEAELKKCVAHNKSVYMLYVVVYSCMHALIFILTNPLYVPVGQEPKKKNAFMKNKRNAMHICMHGLVWLYTFPIIYEPEVCADYFRHTELKIQRNPDMSYFE